MEIPGHLPGNGSLLGGPEVPGKLRKVLSSRAFSSLGKSQLSVKSCKVHGDNLSKMIFGDWFSDNHYPFFSK